MWIVRQSPTKGDPFVCTMLGSSLLLIHDPKLFFRTFMLIEKVREVIIFLLLYAGLVSLLLQKLHAHKLFMSLLVADFRPGNLGPSGLISDC